MKPFLKWAGGKSRLVPDIRRLIPAQSKRLIEPFVGSGAIFLGLGFESAVVADANADLIRLYEHIRSAPEGFIRRCAEFFLPENNTSNAYYRLRERFNTLPIGDFDRAALFVYLNRHGFNGMCRYSKKGAFNIPFGRQTAPHFPATEILAFARRSATTEFRHARFEETMERAISEAAEGDAIYCDPPYCPLSPTANFDAYVQDGFSEREHRLLADLCRKAAHAGIPVIISNHDTDTTRALYAGCSELVSLDVRRSISGSSTGRVKAKEILVRFDGSIVGQKLAA